MSYGVFYCLAIIQFEMYDHELLYSLLLIAQSIQPPNFTKASTFEKRFAGGERNILSLF